MFLLWKTASIKGYQTVQVVQVVGLPGPYGMWSSKKITLSLCDYAIGNAEKVSVMRVFVYKIQSS